MGRSARLLLCGAACALGAVLIVGAASARTQANRFPALFVSAYSDVVGEAVKLDFMSQDLDAGGDIERLTVDVPLGYGGSLVHADNLSLGPASITTVPIGGGTPTTVSGEIVVMPAAAYAAEAVAQACAPGTHPATWAIEVGGLTIPIAVDRHSGGFELAMCFDALHAQHLEISTVEFRPGNVFTNPQVGGKYLFDATATPFAADGTPDVSTDFEMRAYEYLPSSLSAAATYDRATKTLTVTGQLRSNGGPHSGTLVQAWASQSPSGTSPKLSGAARTAGNGTYTITKKLAVPPRYLFTATESLAYPACGGASPAPGGCASYSVDEVDSFVVGVKSK